MTKYRFKPGKPEPERYEYDPDQLISEYEHDVLAEHGMWDNQRDHDIDESIDNDWEKEYEQWIKTLIQEDE